MLRAANFMISIDLLERAAEVLEEQINRHYLAPSQIAGTGIKLAAIYLLDQKPTDALRILNNTAHATKTEKQRIESLLLTARAQSMLKRPNAAIETLSSLNSTVANKLKVDIYWQHRDWQQAASALETLLPDPQKDLDTQEAAMVLQTAAAYKLAGDRASLKRFKNKFEGAMDKTEKAPAFHVVTRDGGDASLSDRATTMRIADEVDLFKDFMDNYKKLP